MYPELVVIGAGVLTTVCGAVLRDKRMGNIGAGITLIGCGALSMRNLATLKTVEETPNVLYSGPASEATEIFGGTGLNVDAIYLPTETRVYYPAPTVTVTTTPRPTDTLMPTNTALPTSTSTPSQPEVPLEIAKAACHEPENPEMLKKIYVREEVGFHFNNVHENCIDSSVVVDPKTGSIQMDLSIRQTEEEYDDTAFLDTFVPIELLPGDRIKLTILDCDEECELFLVDGGGVIIDRSLKATLGDEPVSTVIVVDGWTPGYVVGRLTNRKGDSRFKFLVEKLTK
ncbi:hypothetical protein KBC75_05345 [Candidatus Shapirobacteria bacterium]|nr:hypothetical protein [Candidatus Shapirobacteria bacterium]